MLRIALAVLLSASICGAQGTSINGSQAAIQNQNQAPAQQQSGTILVPAGTQISAKLTSPITSKAKKGDTVRAMVAFPVTVGTRVVIPVGTYLSGVIESIKKTGAGAPNVQIAFTNMVYANGYTVPLESSHLQAVLTEPGSYSRAAEASQTSARQNAFARNAANGLTPPSLPTPPGPPKGFVIGIVASSVAMAVVLILALLHRGHGISAMLFNTGWQFDIVLQNPLSLDAASVAAAVAATPAQ